MKITLFPWSIGVFGALLCEVKNQIHHVELVYLSFRQDSLKSKTALPLPNPQEPSSILHPPRHLTSSRLVHVMTVLHHSHIPSPFTFSPFTASMIGVSILSQRLVKKKISPIVVSVGGSRAPFSALFVKQQAEMTVLALPFLQ
jgi:hypothetical protein